MKRSLSNIRRTPSATYTSTGLFGVPSNKGIPDLQDKIRPAALPETSKRPLLSRLVLRRLRVKRRDQALCCGRDMRLVSNYNILRRDFLSVDSLVCIVVRSDGRTLQRNAGKQAASAGIAQYFSTHRDISFCRRVTTDRSCCHRRVCPELHFAAQDSIRTA